MPIVGIDDTDSRDRGMCTTYVAAEVGDRLAERGATVSEHLLVRCNPAIEHKTRGNAAVALSVDAATAVTATVATETVDELAETDDPDTSPGVVVADEEPESIPADVTAFSRDAVRERHAIGDAEALIERHGYDATAWGAGRGRIGALAAIGAWREVEEWTFERIAYRDPERWGAPRTVDDESVRAAADAHYPTVWDTIDRAADEVVCVPHTPGPVLFGIRGDEPAAVEAAADGIESEPVERAVTFRTNQGTDAHLASGTIGGLADGRSYRVEGVVATAPETRQGGHVFLELAASDSADRIECVAFEPTKRFRDRVRALRPGDEVTACGEVADGTLKLEKFRVRDLVSSQRVTPTCEDCGNRMESAGADQGYRCRDCGTTAPGPVERPLEREVERGWYEVPPVARRHVARPLVRGGFDGATHPER